MNMPAPITLFYAGLLGVVFSILSGRVMFWRFRTLIVTGDGGDPRNHAIIRGHGNFTEYVPIALTLLLVLEMNGAPSAWCHGFGGSLLAARLFHGWGMRRSTGVTLGRRVGAGLTFTVILAMSGLCLIRPF